METHSFRSRASRLVKTLLLVTAASAVVAVPAQASLTAPADNSVQRGDVVISDTGATVNLTGVNPNPLVVGGCNLGARTDIAVTNDAAPAPAVFTASKAGGFFTPTAGIGPISATWLTTNNANGHYTVTSTVTSRVRKPPTPPATVSNSCISVVTTSVAHIELRKFQYKFVDARGQGNVSMNITPVHEWQLQIGSTISTIHPGDGMTVIRMPIDPLATPVLPTDLGACLLDLATCAPATPLTCTEHPAQCEDRLVLMNQLDGNDHIVGVFDLKSKAFAASTSIGNTGAAMANVNDGCGAVRDYLFTKGLDVDSVLGNSTQTIDLPVDGGGPRTVTTNLRALCAFAQAFAVETAATAANPLSGAGILGLPEVSAGVIFHLYASLTIGNAAGPPPAYSVTQSALVPALPVLPALPFALPALPALPITLPAGVPALNTTNPLGLAQSLGLSGRLTQVKGRGWNLLSLHLVGGLNVDTAATPAGSQYPIWLPLLNAGTKADTSIDFAGFGSVTQSATSPACLPTSTTPVAARVCSRSGTVVGVGAAIFGPSPLRLPIIP